MLDTIVKAIRDKKTRWDGLVQLKELEHENKTMAQAARTLLLLSFFEFFVDPPPDRKSVV